METELVATSRLEDDLRAAIATGCESAERLAVLGASLHRAGRPEAALRAFELAAEADPKQVNNWLAVATLRLQLNLPHMALDACNRALQCDPNAPQSLYSAAVVLATIGENHAALHCYDKALAVEPLHYGALRNRPMLLNAVKDNAAARRAARAAIQAYPQDPWLYYNEGDLLLGMRMADEAIEAFQQALALAPDFHRARYALAIALASQGRVREAHTEQATALAAEPQLLHSYRSPLALDALYGTSDVSPDRVAIIAGFEALRMGNWNRYEEFLELFAELIRGEHGLPPLSQHEMPYLGLGVPIAEDLRQLLAIQAAWRVLKSIESVRLFRPPSERSGPIRIAYISANFRPHPNAYLMGDIYARHDRRRFKVYAYSLGPQTVSPERDRAMAAVDVFRDLERLPVDAAAQLIVNDQIDILIDLSGFTRHAKPEILALKPAPIQVSYMGFMGTQGAPYIDYALLDREVLIPESRARWTEHIAYLPTCSYHCELPQTGDGASVCRQDVGIPEDAFVLCALHHPRKLEPYSYRAWLDLLRQLPNSVLWLLYEEPEQISNLRRMAVESGLTEDRLVFSPLVERTQHLLRYRLADICLDTFVYNGHTTTVDALGMGAPVVTLKGDSVVSRVAGSMLKAHGLPELIAETVQEYKTIVTRLACDTPWREEIRRRVSDYEHSQLFCPERRVREIEVAYEMMWARYRTGQAAEDFDVPAKANAANDVDS